MWPNAYKNDRTALSDQLLINNNTKFYFSKPEQRGYINRLDFKVDGTTAVMEDHPEYIDVIKVVLPRPLPPRAAITITTPFHVKLPYNFSRGGYDGETFQCTQWYPKPAVYDKDGWHPMPYLDQGEFYNEFGRYEVAITTPANYVIAATGALQEESERQWLRDRREYRWNPVITHQKTKSNTPAKKIRQQYPFSSSAVKTLHFVQDSVHDFAWFADKRFAVQSDTCELNDGRIINVYTYCPNGLDHLPQQSFEGTKEVIRFYSSRIGLYPYNTVSVVYGPESFGGGMEYPTITVLSSSATRYDEKSLISLIAHEVGHNWFQGILASNERDHAWMDEGINTYFEQEFIKSKYKGFLRPDEFYQLQTLVNRKLDQPIETGSARFSSDNYNYVTYTKTSLWLRAMRDSIGEELFSKLIQDYFSKWKFRHPDPTAFLTELEKVNIPVSSASHELASTGFSYLKKDNRIRIVSLRAESLGPSFVKSIPVIHSSQTGIFPILGYNYYDRFMLGVVVSNYMTPPTRFNLALAPYYAFGSKRFAGIGKMNYSILSRGRLHKTDLFLNGSNFSIDDFRDSADRRLILRFKKLVPGFRLAFWNRDPKSTARTYVGWKTFLFDEQQLRISRDSFPVPGGVNYFLKYNRPHQKRYLNQLSITKQDTRELYPYTASLKLEQGEDFVRSSLSLDYFFNYAKGGLNLRFFAGKFIYLNGRTLRKQFQNDRYLLNMTGANGYEDYTYSDYFIGRNEFEGLASQQIMKRDGFFKVRTDLLASKIGKTDDWLIALNLSSSIPNKINPLAALPVKIPLSVFFDLGAYADAWKRDSELDRVLYDIGLHLPLFSETINIYLPIIYNKVYSDYYKSTITKNRFLKTISFTINLNPRYLQKFNRNFEY